MVVSFSPNLNKSIEQQHVQIDAIADALTSRLESRRPASRNLVSLLNALASHLQTHFDLEEHDGFFATILERAPRLSPQVNRLLRQHQKLQQEANELVEVAQKDFSLHRETTALANRFRQFRSQLTAHETAEVGLMHEAYCCDIGTSD